MSVLTEHCCPRNEVQGRVREGARPILLRVDGGQIVPLDLG